MRTSSKRYHWDTKQNIRNAKGKNIARLFATREEIARNQMAATLGGIMPSPQGMYWLSYIVHRLQVMEEGIDAYTVRSYARLGLDKHIEWHRAIDTLAGKLVNHKPSIIYIGAGGSTPANSPIKIKKYVRCPGTRKLIFAFKKRANCIIRMVDEYMTSQHCARCFKQFPQATRSHRFKKCVGCLPKHIVRLATKIVTNVSKRGLQMMRAIEREFRAMRAAGDAIAATLQDRPNTNHLVSKKQCFSKTWRPMIGNGEIENAAETPLTTVWHRDIAAAKLILYKGECLDQNDFNA